MKTTKTEVKFKPDALPAFDDVDALAAFLDNHSSEDIEGWKPAVDDDSKEDELVAISVRLPRRDLNQLKSAAKRAGVGYSTYTRMLLHRLINSDKD